MVQTGGVLDIKTKTEAQGYAPDWSALEEYFPEIKEIASYADKWAYIQERCRESEENAEFVRQHRPKIANSHRVIENKVVTDDFVEDIVDALVAETWTPLYKYHHSGTGVGAEDATDAALGTPVENARDVGTHVEHDSKTYKSIATTTYTGAHAITEHGVFKTAGAGGPPVVGGILMDRTVFAAINVVNGNQVEWTFTIAFTSGG